MCDFFRGGVFGSSKLHFWTFLHVDYLKLTGLPLLYLRNSIKTNLSCLAPYKCLFPPDPPILPTVCLPLLIYRHPHHYPAQTEF